MSRPGTGTIAWGHSTLRSSLIAQSVALLVVTNTLLAVVSRVATQYFEQTRVLGNLPGDRAVGGRDEISPLTAVNEWFSWDAGHYERLSAQWPLFDRPPLAPVVDPPGGGLAWYELSWPPLHPTFVGVVDAILPVNTRLGMIVAGWALFVALLVVVAKWSTASGDDDRTTRFVMIACAITPLSFLLRTPLSEPLFAVLAALMFWALQRQRWLGAGFAAALLVWTRHGAVLMVVPLLVATLPACRAAMGGWSERSRPLVAPALCGASFIAYSLWTRWLTGSWNAAVLTQQNLWRNELGNPVANILSEPTRWQYLLVVGLFCLTILLIWNRLITPAEAVFVVIILALASATPTIYRAAPRIAATALPLWVGLGRAMARVGESSRMMMSSTMMGLQVALFIVWANWWLRAIV